MNWRPSLLRNADVYSPSPLGVCDVAIAGGCVLAVSASRGDLAITGATEVDLEGRPLVPGLVDAHAHITGGGGESGFASRIPPVPLSRFTRHGVTSAVGLLGTDDTTRTTRDLVASAYALREQGLGAWCYTGGYHVPLTTLTGSARDDMVFLDPVLGVGEVAISDHRGSQPTLDELLRIASDAHVAGLITGKAGIVHLHLGDGERGLDLVRRALHETELPARVFNPTHVNRRKALFEEAVALARGGSSVDVTAYPAGNVDERQWSAHEAVARYLEAGAPPTRITVSSDGGGCLPVFDDEGALTSMDVGSPQALVETLAALVAAGMDLHTALPPFTENPARLLRLHGRGVIAEGGRADLVVLDEQTSPTDVMLGGDWHVRAGEMQRLGRYESR